MEKEIKERAEVRQGDMTEGPILKQLIMFALPLFIGALFQLMYIWAMWGSGMQSLQDGFQG